MGSSAMERSKTVKVEVGDEEWKAAKLFMAKGPSATLQYLKDEPKAMLYALDAQAMDGPLSHLATAAAPSTLMDPALARKQEAWRALGGMSRSEAQRRFVELLTCLLPDWKAWHATHAHLQQPNNITDEASRILSDFSKKTGLLLKSSL